MFCNTYKQFFSNLADETKLGIIASLRKGEKSVKELSQELDFEQSRVSHNLKKLKELGFVNVKPKGKERIYGLDKSTIAPLLLMTDKHVNTYYRHYCKCMGKAKEERWKGK